jgi:hypothetical protein
MKAEEGKMKTTGVCSIIMLFLTLALSAPSFADTVAPVQSGGAKSAVIVNPTIIKYTPKMTVASLADRPGTDLVMLPNGRGVKVQTIRNFHAAAQIMKSPRVDRTPPELKHLPSRTVFTPVRTPYELSAALKLPDSTTIKLPSGQYATIGQIKFVQAMVDSRTGNRLTLVSQRPNLAGPSIKIPPDIGKIPKEQQKAFWENILNQKDETILESPHGIRITVGELRKGMATHVKTMPRPIFEGRPR